MDVDVDPVGSMLHNRKNCRVTFEGTYNGEYGTFAASAVLVGNNLALTAAHCVMDSNGNIHPNWKIYPRYKNGDYYGEITGWSQIYYSENYGPDQLGLLDYHDDWAICILEAPLGEYVDYAGVEAICRFPIKIFK